MIKKCGINEIIIFPFANKLRESRGISKESFSFETILLNGWMDGWMDESNRWKFNRFSIQKPLVPDLKSNETASKDRTCLLVPDKSHGC